MKINWIDLWKNKKVSLWTFLRVWKGDFDSPSTALLWQELPLWLKMLAKRELQPLEDRKFRFDIAFPIAGYAVEVDGYSYHLDKDYDRERDRLIGKTGWVIDRFSASDVHRQTKLIVKTIVRRFWVCLIIPRFLM